ncbi:unnamed protein product [Sphagnum jensenii]|uniref:Uncharacterized protein n=1 Tax=Sphagnum jensenii TaxID=128206 RepID=A0ABP0WL69_9BRYO
MRVLEGKQITDEEDTGQRILRIEGKVKRAGKTQGRNERGERNKRNNGNDTKSIEKRTLQIAEKEEVMNERTNNPSKCTSNFFTKAGRDESSILLMCTCIYPYP